MSYARGLLAYLIVVGLLGTTSAYAVCSVPPKSAGRDPAYLYVAGQIDGLIKADNALGRMSRVSKFGNRPNQTETREALTTLELAASEFECAAAAAKKEKFQPPVTNETGRLQAAAADRTAELASLTYWQLAGDARAIAALYQRNMKGSIGKADLEREMDKAWAKLQERLADIVTVMTSLSSFLIDPVPDASGRASRLQITQKERDDLINSLDKSFGARARRNTENDLSPIDAGVAVIREWLATSGHKTRP
jgi:hypothetical protein